MSLNILRPGRRLSYVLSISPAIRLWVLTRFEALFVFHLELYGSGVAFRSRLEAETPHLCECLGLCGRAGLFELLGSAHCEWGCCDFYAARAYDSDGL